MSTTTDAETKEMNGSGDNNNAKKTHHPESNGDDDDDGDSNNNNNNNNKKRPKLNTLFQEILASDIVERQDALKKAYSESSPYPHAHMRDVFLPDFLNAVKEEIKSHTKVNFKESDLFRVYQSIDMANLEPGSELSIQLPHVMKLRELLYSQEWRSFMEGLAGLPPSTLTSQIDCACNCHAPGCHLLCHDDVIGTRKVSYIIYLTEEDWQPEEGGSLELYEPQSDDPSSCNPLPVARAWPAFNSMAFFVVEPGASFHAVQEVMGDRPRLSLQGWFHATDPPKNIELATLQQLKARRADKKSKGEGDDDDDDLALKFNSEEASSEFTEKDKEYLGKYVKAEYLTKESMDEMQKCFEKDSSVQLRNFLLDKWVPKMEPQKSIVYDDSYYKSGISSEWKLTGPAHKQRYLEYEPAATTTTNGDSSSCLSMQGPLMHHVKQKVFESEQMARYLKALTSLEKPTGIRTGKIRRFRPGLDYTVAHYGLLVEKAVLDATMCFVYDENDDRDAWESGDVGGFECYIEADDDDDDDDGGAEGGGSGPADEYNEDDDTELLSVSASNNTLSLVYRDPGTMRFVKYVGSSAPSSRYDICMEYEVDANDDDEEEDEEDPTNEDSKKPAVSDDSKEES